MSLSPIVYSLPFHNSKFYTQKVPCVLAFSCTFLHLSWWLGFLALSLIVHVWWWYVTLVCWWQWKMSMAHAHCRILCIKLCWHSCKEWCWLHVYSYGTVVIVITFLLLQWFWHFQVVLLVSWKAGSANVPTMTLSCNERTLPCLL
jgi:hypothetical protein